MRQSHGANNLYEWYGLISACCCVQKTSLLMNVRHKSFPLSSVTWTSICHERVTCSSIRPGCLYKHNARPRTKNEFTALAIQASLCFVTMRHGRSCCCYCCLGLASHGAFATGWDSVNTFILILSPPALLSLNLPKPLPASEKPWRRSDLLLPVTFPIILPLAPKQSSSIPQLICTIGSAYRLSTSRLMSMLGIWYGHRRTNLNFLAYFCPWAVMTILIGKKNKSFNKSWSTKCGFLRLETHSHNHRRVDLHQIETFLLFIDRHLVYPSSRFLRQKKKKNISSALSIGSACCDTDT